MAIVVHNTLWENIPVADEIKPYIIHTVELRHMPEEEVEYQVFHRAQAQIFLFKAATSTSLWTGPNPHSLFHNSNGAVLDT